MIFGERWPGARTFRSWKRSNKAGYGPEIDVMGRDNLIKAAIILWQDRGYSGVEHLCTKDTHLMPFAVCGNKGLPVAQSMIQVLLLYAHAPARPFPLLAYNSQVNGHPPDSVGPAAMHPSSGRRGDVYLE